MENTRTYITELTESVIDNHFPSVDNISQLITPDTKRATRIIVNKIKRIIDEFETYCPLVARTIINLNGTDGNYAFKDNYIDVVEGRVPETELELIPMTIAKVSGAPYVLTNMASTANYWKYHRPVLSTFRSIGGEMSIDALYHYPIYIQYTDDGYLNKFSHIYGLDRKQKSMLFNLTELRFLQFIKGANGKVKLPVTIDFFNVDEEITQLDELVKKDITSCSALKVGWQ